MLTPQSLELCTTSASALSPHSASLSPSDFTSLGASDCQGGRLCFLKISRTVSTPTAQERSRYFFSSTVIQLVGGAGRRVRCQFPSGKQQTWGSPTRKCSQFSSKRFSFAVMILMIVDTGPCYKLGTVLQVLRIALPSLCTGTHLILTAPL